MVGSVERAIHVLEILAKQPSVGVSANVQLVASSSVFPYASELGTGISDVALPGASALVASGGFLTVPEAPGFGVDTPRGFFDQADVVRRSVMA